MARLDEPPTESLDSITRRFVRQNRDLTRANATQSIKIRALENQVSALLAENLALRENVIQLRVEAEESRIEAVLYSVKKIQKQLERKVQEFSGLLLDLGTVKNKSRRRKSQLPSIYRSPKTQYSRDRTMLAEVESIREGQLPTITEDKYYPRKTMDASELVAMLSQESTDSPETEIGSPPTTSFGREAYDGPNQERSHQEPRNISENVAEDMEPPVIMSKNFDTRRRRRESYVRSDDSTEANGLLAPAAQSAESEALSSRALRAGAKRKLDDRDQGMPDSQSNFTFIRRRHGGESGPASVEQDPSLAATNVLTTNVVLRPWADEVLIASPTRKALATKSSNMSPVKAVVLDGAKDQQPDKFRRRPGPDSGEHIVDARLPQEHLNTPNDPQSSLPVVEIKLEPTTPAPPFDLISPASTQPSELGYESLGARPSSPRPSNEHLVAGTGRPSRRARAQVSYAEPNLVSKMRRPTKELADAVAPTHSQHSNGVNVPIQNIKQEEEVGAPEPPVSLSNSRTVILSQPEATDKAWRKPNFPTLNNAALPSMGEPRSPLTGRTASAIPTVQNQEMDRVANRDRRRSSYENLEHKPFERTVSSVTLGTLISSSARQDRTDTGTDKSLQQAMQALDIYDVQDSPQAERTLQARVDSDARATTHSTSASSAVARKDKPSTTPDLVQTNKGSTSRTTSTTASSTTTSLTTNANTSTQRPHHYLQRSSSTNSLPPRSRTTPAPTSSTSLTNNKTTSISANVPKPTRPSTRRQTLGSGDGGDGPRGGGATRSRSSSSFEINCATSHTRKTPDLVSSSSQTPESITAHEPNGSSGTAEQAETTHQGVGRIGTKIEEASERSDGLRNGRLDRIASRRRSMML